MMKFCCWWWYEAGFVALTIVGEQLKRMMQSFVLVASMTKRKIEGGVVLIVPPSVHLRYPFSLFLDACFAMSLYPFFVIQKYCNNGIGL
jgi:hypothetical protein